jgi:hypothetical protein
MDDGNEGKTLADEVEGRDKVVVGKLLGVLADT